MAVKRLKLIQWAIPAFINCSCQVICHENPGLPVVGKRKMHIRQIDGRIYRHFEFYHPPAMIMNVVTISISMQ
jgi:hypothetical protein